MPLNDLDLHAIGLLTLEVFAVASLSLVLFRARHRLGLGPLFILIGSNQYLSLVLASAVLVKVSPTLSVSPGSVVLFGASVFSILLVYLRTDIPNSRGLIYGVVIANASLAALVWYTATQIEVLQTSALVGVPLDFFAIQPRIFLTGTFILLIDFFLVIVLYELLFLLARYIPHVVRIILSISGVLIFDSLVFGFIAFYGAPQFGDILRGQIIGKTYAAILYGSILYFYLKVVEPSDEEKFMGDAQALRHVFSIITYRERYRMAQRALQEAEAANVAKNRFLSNMSHELRTPLNAVIGFTSVLVNRQDRSADETHMLERIMDNGEHLLQLINGLLDLSKIESGKSELQISHVQPDTLIYETVSQLQIQAQSKNLLLEASISAPCLPLLADRLPLKQVLINLIGNALKFTDKGHISVHLEVDEISGHATKISVTDTGIGIPPDKIKAIFTPFFQLEHENHSSDSTGLGLAISKALCDRMGYLLQVTSTPGKGSCFTIEFGDAETPSGNQETDW